MLDRLLDQALEQPPEQRQGFVSQCCQKAPHLGFWLKRLVMASGEPTSFIDQSASHLAADAMAARSDIFPRTLVRGTRFGPWKILGRIGAGGMGEVYQAERADGAFEMQVAIKLIRSRKKNLARLLESERQLMARLNHASIARLIDGGMADDERPYLVMEWVDGQTLGEWVHRDGISAEHMLDVFMEICQALAFAHRSLVVHGDIKPANLAINRDGQVKLLDFGVAQILGSDDSDRSPSALTPGFAAPEQLDGKPVSTASDIYSLGALLRWLVFGKASKESGQRLVPRPAWQGYRRLFDLEAIIDQAMAPEPEDRYATVNALALDTERLQEDFPVKARRPRPWERIGLWVRRRKLAAAMGGMAMLGVVVGLSVALWQARIVAQERDVARHEAAVSLAVKDHLVLLFREVSSLSEDSRELTARELLDATAEAASDWLRDDPTTRAEILLAIAEILISLDDYRSAEPLLEDLLQTLGEAPSPTLAAKLYRNMAMVLHRRGEISEGFEMADRAVRKIEGFSGDHRERLSDALQMRARLARERGDWAGSVADLQRARTLAQMAAEGPRPVLARAEANLAANYVIGGHFHTAVQHMEAAEALWYALGRSSSPDALSNMQNLAVVLERLGRVDEAESRFRHNIATRKERLGQSGALAAAKLQFGRMLLVKGQFEEAERLIRNAETMMARFVGESSPDFGSTQIGLGELHQARGNGQEAGESYSSAESIFTNSLGKAHPFTLFAASGRLATHALADPELDAGPEFQQLIERLQQAGPGARSFLAHVHCERAVWRIRHNLFEHAEQDAMDCAEIRSDLSLGGWRQHEAEALRLLAAAGQGSTDAAEQLPTAVDRLAETMAEEHSRLQWFRDQSSSL